MTTELTISNLDAMVYHLKQGEDNCGLSKDALSNFLEHLQRTVAALTAERDKWKAAYELADTPLNDSKRLELEDQIKALTAERDALRAKVDALEQELALAEAGLRNAH